MNNVLNLYDHGEVLIGADLNAKHPSWGGTSRNTSGDILNSLLHDCPNFIAVSSDIPTRPNETSGSFLDLFLRTPGLPLVGGGSTSRAFDFESDHRGIQLQIDLGNIARQEREEFLNFDRINISRFRRRIREGLDICQLPADRNDSVEEVDRCVDDLSDVFRRAIDTSVPKQKVRDRTLGDLPPRILMFIRERRRLCRTLRRSRDPDRYPALRADIRNLGHIIQDSIRIFEQDRLKSYLARVRVDGKTFGKVKRAAGLGGKNPIEQLVDDSGSILTDDCQKAEAIADYVQGALRADGGPVDSFAGGPVNRVPGEFDSFRSSVNGAAEGINDRSPLVTFTRAFSADGASVDNDSRWNEGGFLRVNNVGRALARRPARKSTGLDQIPDIALKNAAASGQTTATNVHML
ncbi:uncharacterized protein [Musca autumnalis]|uniref:uncharacterized protein n=1 Tax=Musca autumnalis TaxID=221902 RepID=UPI003CE89718